MGGADFIETTFEGYGANGIAILVESATDNNTRTVANIRSYFNKYGGSLGKDGCLQFIFERKGIFIIPPGKLDEEEFTMEMIDAGAEDVEFPQEQGDEYITISSGMEEFGSIQKKLDELKIEPVEAGLEQIPTTYKEVNQETYDKAMKLIDVIEDDDDVQKVYHNMDLDE